MRQRGFIVDVAKDGEEAWQLANHFPYAVIATDLRMPGLDGMMLIEQLKELQPDPVCLLVTGVAQLDWYGEDPEARGVRVIRKPWNGDQLADAIRRALEQYREHRWTGCLESEAPETDIGVRVLVVQEHNSGVGPARLLKENTTANYVVAYADGVHHARELLARNQYEVCLIEGAREARRTNEVVMELAEHRPSMPILALGPLDDDHAARGAMKAGAHDYLCTSELTSQTLERAIRYAIEQKRVGERLAFMAQHDDLTRLANRALVRERLSAVIEAAKAKNIMAGVLFLDLDRFKGVIDSLGHQAGDELLRQVAERLKGCVRETDTVGRLGGDEFAIVLDELSRIDVATALAQRVLNSFATPFTLSDHEVVTTASIGIALYPENGEDPDILLKHADAAMYRAKEAGRNNYQYFGEELHRRAIQRLCMESELRNALDNEEFVVYYQPKVNVGDNRITGAEALIRWQQPSGRLVAPLDFIPVLEDTGLIVPVGEWVLRRALQDTAELRKRGFNDFRIAVNVSAVQFEDEDFMETVKRALATADLPESALELEITEGVLMRDNERTRRSMEALRRINVRLSIDDFGTGYCTLVCLKRFPVQALKIDRSFIKDIGTNIDDAAIASAVVALAHGLGLEVVAEGVETQNHVDFLRKVGCEYIQGYHVSPPRSFDEFFEFLIGWGAPPSDPVPGRHSIGRYSSGST
jgi:diguanylate cyclase (GGDEF)-like protein